MTACACGGRWTASETDGRTVWGIHRGPNGDPTLPTPGCRRPDGTYVEGQTRGGYICADGSILD